jgi:ketosteroid isomerase-like protein
MILRKINSLFENNFRIVATGLTPKLVKKISMKWLLTSSALLSFTFSLAAQRQAIKSPLRAMVETEQAFSKTSHERGTREAFMQFIADDGILFRPKAVLGKQWMIDHPLPPETKRSLLAWQPVFAVVSAAGDMGYTTGPWEFKADINDGQPSGYGEFITVWKRQPDATWKFAVDLGISHPQSAGPLKIWQVKDRWQSRSIDTIDFTAAKTLLLTRDAEFAILALSQGGANAAFSKYAADDVRLFREGSFPFVGKTATVRALADRKEITEWQPSGSGVSVSGDLGYVYGTFQTNSYVAARKMTGAGNFLRIWQKRDSVWLIVLDVASAFP